MRVLQINVDWNQGGPGSIERFIYDTLIDEGHECFVACGRGPCDIKNSIRIGTKRDVYVHLLLSRLTDREGQFSKHATKQLIQEIKTINPDIIQLHNLLGHYINYPLLFEFIRNSKIQTVWTLHDCWSVTGHCINFERISCDKWKKEGCNHCELQHDYPKSLILDRSYENYEFKKQLYGNIENLHIVTPSEWLARIIKDSFMSQYKINVFHNGIDLSRYKPTESTLRSEYQLQGKIILLSVAYNWNEMKGYKLLQQIAEKLDDRFKIVMIGNKDEGNLSSKILSLPVTSDFDALIKWYSAADVFVNPTLGDNFPTVNIEALSCGTPVVTCDTGGSPEAAGNEFGRIVYSKTADEFVTKIQECIDSHYTSEDCHEYAQRFEMNKCYQKYVELYKSLLNSQDRESM